MIKLVAFDWNGTLFADTTALADGANQVLRLFKLKPASILEYQKHFDVPVKKTYIGLGIPENRLDGKSKQIAETFHLFYEKRASNVRTRANAKKLLAWLEKNKIPSIIFSNHIEDKIVIQLDRLKIKKYFSAVLANYHIESSQKARMKKEKLREYVKIENLRPKEILVIGDTIEEIEIGKEMSYITVGLTGGSCTVSRLKGSNPDFIISNLSQVIPIINKLNK